MAQVTRLFITGLPDNAVNSIDVRNRCHLRCEYYYSKVFVSVSLSVLICILPLTGFAQDKSKKKADAKTSTQTQAPSTPAAATPPRPALAFGLVEDTPVRLTINRTVSSATARVNDKIDFDVVEDVKVGDVIVIPHGSTAIATVTAAQPRRRLGRSGKLNLNIDYVQLASGEKAALRAVQGGNGGDHKTAVTSAVIATGILFFPAAPIFLFIHGKDLTIPKGTEITAYIAADTVLDPAKFGNAQNADTANATSMTQPNSAATSSIIVKSTPDAADITVDGKFMGSTQSTLQIIPGEHTISIEKSGFKTWTRVLTVNENGSVTVEATLEKNP